MQLNHEKLRKQLNHYVPITAWLPAYPRDFLRSDLISGVTVWAVMVPVAMAYAEMAGLPPEFGLYTAFAALLGYAIFGTSRQLKVTTSSTMAVMSAAVVVVMAAGDPVRYAALSAALALTVGVILLLAGVARLGFISDFLSKSVVTGFVFGLALVIAIGQVPKLLGLPSGQGDFFEQSVQVIINLSQINPYTLVVGVSALVVIFLIKRFVPRLPAGLVALVLGILAVSIFHLDEYGVSIVGDIPTGLPTPGLPQVGGATRPVVILRLRAHEGIGSSFVTVLERYSQQVKAVGGRLMVAGISKKVKGQLDRTETTSDLLGQENVFVATTNLGASTRAALAAAQRWLEQVPAAEASGGCARRGIGAPTAGG